MCFLHIYNSLSLHQLRFLLTIYPSHVCGSAVNASLAISRASATIRPPACLCITSRGRRRHSSIQLPARLKPAQICSNRKINAMEIFVGWKAIRDRALRLPRDSRSHRTVRQSRLDFIIAIFESAPGRAVLLGRGV